MRSPSGLPGSRATSPCCGLSARGVGNVSARQRPRSDGATTSGAQRTSAPDSGQSGGDSGSAIGLCAPPSGRAPAATADVNSIVLRRYNGTGVSSVPKCRGRGYHRVREIMEMELMLVKHPVVGSQCSVPGRLSAGLSFPSSRLSSSQQSSQW